MAGDSCCRPLVALQASPRPLSRLAEGSLRVARNWKLRRSGRTRRYLLGALRVGRKDGRVEYNASSYSEIGFVSLSIWLVSSSSSRGGIIGLRSFVVELAQQRPTIAFHWCRLTAVRIAVATKNVRRTTFDSGLQRASDELKPNRLKPF